MTRSIHRAAAWLLLVATGLVAWTTPVHAETGTAMLVTSKFEEEPFRLDFDTYLFSDGETDRPGNFDFEMNIYDAEILWRENVEEPHGLVGGASMHYVDLRGSDPILPTHLLDASVGLGAHIGEWNDWDVEIAGGIGYAGDAPLKDSDAIYFLGDVMFTKQLDELSSLTIDINYDGNRAIFPDVPLPAVMYNKRISDEWQVSVGVPVNMVTWQPAENVRVRMRYFFPVNFDARVDVDLNEAWSIYGAYENHFDSYTIHRGREHRRLFFEQRRVEAGLSWEPCPTASLRIAGGYGFDGEFSTGWDVRDTDDVVDVSDEPYIRIGFEVRF